MNDFEKVERDDMSVQFTAELLAKARLKAALNSLVEHAATCKGENDALWLRLLADRLDLASVALGSKYRFLYRDTLGVDWIERIPG